ncbi:hypothetical protein H1R17_01580 [Flavobacterium sp. xlx-214]|uniref:hypothetical protein n=1 Tax=unclassified Flavobacterium TaxID=196869 RepID=UPI0013D6B1F1|nr:MULTISPECIES: hypothetical protein [unclassified Flavobacterium]MBA5792712.1 hypothetical protein [Flavobacterium sp. xlx-221]QMI83856.1 hypothetical protein H1R17_01580 [Flavobacterium sp. xlx-214]
MKTKLLIVPFLLLTGVVFGQEKNISDEDKKTLLGNANKDFVELEKEYTSKLAVYEVEKKKFEELVKEVNLNTAPQFLNEIQTQQQTTKTLNNELVEIIKKYESYKVYYTTKGLTIEEIKEIFVPNKNIVAITDTAVPTKIVTYFGENETIDHEILKDKSGKEVDVIKKVLSTEGKDHYFGDITIPQKGAKFFFYESNKNKVFTRTANSFKFKKVDVKICDGYFSDIVLHVEDEKGNTHIFNNQVGISILFFTSHGNRKFLYYTHSEKKDGSGIYEDKQLDNFYIKLTDVFSYSYDIGNHYIPLELDVKLPADTIDNKDSNVKYKIQQKTSLEKIVELRAYSDFLALFGEAENGLVQIDGKATFYLFPYPYSFFGSKKTLGQIEYLPTISPYVNYSRFENISRYAKIENLERLESLGLIEKRYLTMGVEGDVLKWQHKNSPVKLSLYGFINYNIAEINNGTEDKKDIKDIKSLGFGGGLHLSTKRFNNFGFDYKIELSEFDYENHNGEGFPINKIPVLRNEAEVFYHPNGNPNSAIFVRLINYNYRGRANDQAFYQFQFGYKFAIGNRTVSK